MYLVDTNVFLEILLKQERSEACKTFLIRNDKAISISDFTLQSIGVILFQQKEEQTFLNFITDLLPKTNLLTLPKPGYHEILTVKRKYSLDFDDAYQTAICMYLLLLSLVCLLMVLEVAEAAIYFFLFGTPC